MTGEEGRSVPATGLTAAQISRVVDTAVNPFVLIDAAGTTLWAGSSVQELLGVPADEMVGRSMLDFVAPDALERALHLLAHADAGRPAGDASPTSWEGIGPILELRRADGTAVSCAIAVATPTRTGLAGYVLQLRRADPTQALERTLLAMGTNQPLHHVLAEVAEVLRGELPDAEVVILHADPLSGRTEPIADHDGLLHGLELPSAFGQAWGLAHDRPGEVVERGVADLPEPLRQAMIPNGIRWMSLLAVPTDALGDTLSAAVVSVWSRAEFPMHFLNHERLQRCGNLTSMALRWEYGRRALEWSATHDGLTGLLNRTSFLAELRLAGGLRRRSADKTAVLYLDLDDFKPVNDRHGHTLGDRVLVEVSSRLRSVVRPTDVVARLGGDEFAVLCAGLDDLEVAEQLAQRLVASVSEAMEVDGIAVQIGLSVGIAALAEGEDVERVLTRADDALRTAKVQGKARWQIA